MKSITRVSLLAITVYVGSVTPQHVALAMCGNNNCDEWCDSGWVLTSGEPGWTTPSNYRYLYDTSGSNSVSGWRAENQANYPEWDHCATFSEKWFLANDHGSIVGYQIPVCTSCDSGYELYNAEFPMDVYELYRDYSIPSENNGYTCNYFEMQGCSCNLDCDWEGDWSLVDDINHVVERERGEYPNPNPSYCECNTGYDQSCAAGYYGEPWGSGNAGCQPCPYNGTSDPGNNENITDCYLATGTHTDNRGTFALTNMCYWQGS